MSLPLHFLLTNSLNSEEPVVNALVIIITFWQTPSIKQTTRVTVHFSSAISLSGLWFHLSQIEIQTVNQI